MRALHVHWQRVFEDFAALGLTGHALAERIGLRVGLLARVASGKQAPASNARDRIIGLWCHLTSKPVQFLPRTTDAEGAPRPEVPGIDSNVGREPAYATLQAILTVWAQIERQ